VVVEVGGGFVLDGGGEVDVEDVVALVVVEEFAVIFHS